MTQTDLCRRAFVPLALISILCAVEVRPQIQESIDLDPATDSPEVLRTVADVETDPSDQNILRALALVDSKLKNWGTVSKRSTCDILAVFEQKRTPKAVSRLERLLATNCKLEGSDLIASYAASALGAIGGERAYVALSRTVEGNCRGRVRSAALALGQLKDRRAIPKLEQMTTNESPEVRKAGIVALAHFCDPGSRIAVNRAATDVAADVRAGAAWWLATCGELQLDEGTLLGLLDDASPQVRINSLKGLIRIGSRRACEHLHSLEADENASVRELSNQLQPFCSEPPKPCGENKGVSRP
jgi:HEAT repeat protein